MSVQSDIQTSTVTVTAIHSNTELTLIQITEDKLRLSLIDHLGRCEQRKAWQVPAGILFALVPVLLTSEFKDTFSIDKATWKALFLLISSGSCIWLVLTAVRALQSISLDHLVKRIKNDSSSGSLS